MPNVLGKYLNLSQKLECSSHSGSYYTLNSSEFNLVYILVYWNVWNMFYLLLEDKCLAGREL